jgi:hypothetical protein
MSDHLRKLEHEVEIARSRLKSDLTVLSSPGTYASFKETLKTEANSTLDNILDGLKARASQSGGRPGDRRGHRMARYRATTDRNSIDWRRLIKLISDRAQRKLSPPTARLSR